MTLRKHDCCLDHQALPKEVLVDTVFGPAIGTAVVAIGTVGTDLAIDIVTIDLSMATVEAGGVIIDGRCSVGACTVSFFLFMKEMAPSPQQTNNTWQVVGILRNHAHLGQPPPSVVVAVVVVHPPIVNTDIEMAPAILVNVCVMLSVAVKKGTCR